MWTLSSYFPSPESVQNLPIGKMALFSTSVDKLLIIFGFACPIFVQVFWNLTEVWQCLDCTWMVTWQTLYMTCFWTVLGWGLDRGWKNIGFSVQYLSNQPKLTSTNVHNMFKICTIPSNRFETDFEPATGMRMVELLKNCLKCKHLCINKF